MTKQGKIRTLLSASMLAMICAGLLVGGTYALFTDTVKITHHLQAGNLKISLIREKLTKNTYDNTTGNPKEVIDEEVKDFTNNTSDNIFGLEEGEYIVPTSSFTADMAIINGVKGANGAYISSTVAFDYSVAIVLGESDEALAKQLKVETTYNNAEGEAISISKYLSELTSATTTETGYTLFSGEMDKTISEAKFTVKLVFIDITIEEDENQNNAAQNQKAEFDLVVSAVQKTTADE